MADTKLSYVKIFLVIILMVASTWLHLFNIQNTFIFQNDEARDVLISLKMIQSQRPVLLGPETSVGNMYLGPFYYYLMAPALYLSGLDPVGPAIMVAIFGIITTLLIFVYTKRKYGFWAAILAASFYTLSPIMLHHSRSSWNPNVIPFFIILLLLIDDYKKPISQILFGILVGIIFQLHYVALILPGLIFLYHSYHYLHDREYKNFFKLCSFALLGFLIASAPYWAFELRHNFVNVRAFFNYIFGNPSGDVNYPSFLSRFFANIKLLINGAIYSQSQTSQIPSTITSLTLIALVGIAMLARNLHLNIIIVSLLVLSVLKDRMNIHYLAFLFPSISIFIGSLFNYKYLKYLLVILAIYLFGLYQDTYKYGYFTVYQNSSIIKSQEVAKYIVGQADGRPYNVVGSEGSFINTISYFLAISSNPPRNDLQKLVFDICFGGPCKADEETTVLLFLSGPSHPSLVSYLGHPAINEFSTKRKIIKNEWVSYDVYVATIELLE